jgi:hypothetical protein
VLDNLLGIDPFLDEAIEYSLDGEDYSDEEDSYDDGDQ